MAFPRPFVRLTAEGVFGTAANNSVEIWRCNFNFATNSGQTYSPQQVLAFCTAAYPVLSAYHVSANTKAGTGTFLVAASGAVIGVDGKYLGGGSQPTMRYTGTAAAGSGAATGPFSQALCITFRSAIVRGPGSHGRVYWPATALAPGGLGVLSTAQQSSIATTAQTMLNGLNAACNGAFGSGHTLTNMSQVAPGVAAPVIQLQIGARLDTQERREKKLPEAYVSLPVQVGLLSVQNRDRRLQDAYDAATKDLADLEV